MDLATIQMERPKAREAFLAYKREVARRHDVEDEAIMRGYRELARGRQLINIDDVMQQGGQHPNRMPKLAVCRADEQWCLVETRTPHGLTFAGYMNGDDGRWTPHRAPSRRVYTDGWDVLPGHLTARELRAMVPLVPPQLRPAHHLRNYHVLWEAEWSPRPAPPRDPALLKRIDGALFAVLAVWDLTELERAVLGAVRG